MKKNWAAEYIFVAENQVITKCLCYFTVLMFYNTILYCETLNIF